MTIPDNYDLFEAHDREMERRERMLPKCEWCGSPIYQESAFRINGCWYCDDCLSDLREDIDEYADFNSEGA